VVKLTFETAPYIEVDSHNSYLIISFVQAVILARGLGNRLSEATNLIPKPMVEIGRKPILWYIMKTYSHYGINDFIICCGYKYYVIKEYFANYFRHNSDMRVDLSDNTIQILDNHSENWKVTMVIS